MTRLTPAVFALLGSTFAATAALAAIHADARQPVVAQADASDRGLSCEELRAQPAAVSPQRAVQAVPSRRMFGFAAAALHMAAPLAGDIGGGSNASALIGTVAQQATLAAVRNAASPASGGLSDEPAAPKRPGTSGALQQGRGC